MDNVVEEFQNLEAMLVQIQQNVSRNFPKLNSLTHSPSGIENVQDAKTSSYSRSSRRPPRLRKSLSNNPKRNTNETSDLQVLSTINQTVGMLELENENQTRFNSKRNRRLPRRLRKSISINREITDHINLSLPSTSNQCEKHVASFVINQDKMPKLDFSFNTSVLSSAGSYIRSRNIKAKYIRLRSFLNTQKKCPCIFNTDYSAIKLNANLKKSFLNSKQVLKLTFKKYPKFGNIKERKKHESSHKESDKTSFPNYIDESEIDSGFKTGRLIEGFIRINPKNSKDAYVNNEDSSIPDYYLTSVKDRNRALEGDKVVLELKPENEWTSNHKTARVVFLKQKVHPRIVVGTLKPSEKRNADYALLYPRDKRCPILRISDVYLPNGFKDQPQLYETVLFLGKILSWEVPSYANGVLTENLGMAGDLKVETLSILREYCLDTKPFPEEIKAKHLSLSEIIPQQELDYREDLRSDCIFTIDPETARDLDDAVSVKNLPEGNYEIGVHISDVTYYLNEGTELDHLVSKKATTVYMVDDVYHMLPEELCLHCSLLPGKDKMAFSVFWVITTDGEIISKRFCRSVVHSCAKLSYENAQLIIDNPPGTFSTEEFPEIHNFCVDDLAKTINILQTIAVKLRQKRIDSGALKIDQTKLQFKLEPGTREPIDFSTYENKAAHRLIEEFMLLANITVAEKIAETFPKIAFLRSHMPPKQTMLADLRNCLSSYGIHIDTSSSGAIRSSMRKYETDDFAGKCRSVVLNHLIAKAMTRANYFCASLVKEDEGFDHYALSVPIYTHFTSPIRRYADIMVHRLLAASLNYCDPPEWDVQYVAEIAANCNGQKHNAKRAGEASSGLYLAHYVQEHKPYIQDCAVVDVKERSFDAIVLKTGSIIRLYQNNCGENTKWKTFAIPVSKSEPEPSDSENGAKLDNEKRQLKLQITFPKTKYFPSTTLDVEIFTIVKVSLEWKKNSYKLEGMLQRPLQQQLFTKRA